MTNYSKRTSKSTGAGGLVQFRADDKLIRNLTAMAERLELPVGVLARLWVSERLEKEQTSDFASLDSWRAQRYHQIDSVLQSDFVEGPIQIMQIVPFNRSSQLEPERIRKYQGMLLPVERASEFSGRINLDGYETTKQFKSEQKLAGRVQVFRSGALESIREIRTDENRCIYAETFEDDFIRALWSYSCALQALEIQTPVVLFVGFKRIKGYHLKTLLASLAPPIQSAEFVLQSIVIDDWIQLVKIENAAQTVKNMLDSFSNASGLPRSLSYSAKGTWLGSVDSFSPTTWRNQRKMMPKTDVIELFGLNRDSERSDLYLHDQERSLVIGKVRLPFLEPTEKTLFKCLVNDDELTLEAKKLLYRKYINKIPVSCSVDSLKFSGVLTKFHEGLGAGAFDGVNIPQEKTLWFEIQSQPGLI